MSSTNEAVAFALTARGGGEETRSPKSPLAPLACRRCHKCEPPHEQSMLAAPSVDDYLAGDQSVRASKTYVDELDVAAPGFASTACILIAGQLPYDLADRLDLDLYGYLDRVRSCGLLAADYARNLELSCLLRGRGPGGRRVAACRKTKGQRNLSLAAAPECGKRALHQPRWHEIASSKQHTVDACYVGTEGGATGNWRVLEQHTKRRRQEFLHLREFVSKIDVCAVCATPYRGQGCPRGQREHCAMPKIERNGPNKVNNEEVAPARSAAYALAEDPRRRPRRLSLLREAPHPRPLLRLHRCRFAHWLGFHRGGPQHLRSSNVGPLPPCAGRQRTLRSRLACVSSPRNVGC